VKIVEEFQIVLFRLRIAAFLSILDQRLIYLEL